MANNNRRNKNKRVATAAIVTPVTKKFYQDILDCEVFNHIDDLVDVMNIDLVSEIVDQDYLKDLTSEESLAGLEAIKLVSPELKGDADDFVLFFSKLVSLLEENIVPCMKTLNQTVSDCMDTMGIDYPVTIPMDSTRYNDDEVKEGDCDSFNLALFITIRQIIQMNKELLFSETATKTVASTSNKPVEKVEGEIVSYPDNVINLDKMEGFISAVVKESFQETKDKVHELIKADINDSEIMNTLNAVVSRKVSSTMSIRDINTMDAKMELETIDSMKTDVIISAVSAIMTSVLNSTTVVKKVASTSNKPVVVTADSLLEDFKKETKTVGFLAALHELSEAIGVEITPDEAIKFAEQYTNFIKSTKATTISELESELLTNIMSAMIDSLGSNKAAKVLTSGFDLSSFKSLDIKFFSDEFNKNFSEYINLRFDQDENLPVPVVVVEKKVEDKVEKPKAEVKKPIIDDMKKDSETVVKPVKPTSPEPKKEETKVESTKGYSKVIAEFVAATPKTPVTSMKDANDRLRNLIERRDALLSGMRCNA